VIAYLIAGIAWVLFSLMLGAYGLGDRNRHCNHAAPLPAPPPLPQRQPGASLVWLPDYADSPVTAAGDWAALEVSARQQARDARYRGRAKHAAEWLTDVTGEYAVVAVVYPKEVAA
jgi:hypothetical protein